MVQLLLIYFPYNHLFVQKVLFSLLTHNYELYMAFFLSTNPFSCKQFCSKHKKEAAIRTHELIET